jgi:hypothetical protein
VARPDEEGGEKRVVLPPARSGPKMLAVIVALILVFLGVVWYFTFVALESRGPDRVVLDQESWQNGTITVLVKDVRSGGAVVLGSLNVTIRTAANLDLYAGPPGDTVALQGFNLTVRYLDSAPAQEVSVGDKIVITADPPEAIDNLILSTLYLTSEGREWSRLPIPP